MQFEAFGKTWNIGKKEVPIEDTDFDNDSSLDATGEVIPENYEYEVGIPTINAIPDAVIRKYQVQGVIRQYGFIVGCVALAFVGLAIVTGLFLMWQSSTVDALNKERDSLKSEAEILSPYQEYKGAVDGKRAALAATTESDINYGHLFGAIRSAGDANGIQIETLSFTQFGNIEGETGGCVSPDPLNTSSGVIGCASIIAKTPNENSIVSFLNQLTANKDYEGGFALPSVKSYITDEEGSSKVEMSIFVTTDFYSQKYSDLKITLDEVIAKSAEANNKKEQKNETTPAEDKDIPTIAAAVRETLETPEGFTPEAEETAMNNLIQVTTSVCETNDTGGPFADAVKALADTFKLSEDQIASSVKEKC